MNEFRVLPAYERKPLRNPFHFLYAIHEHPKRTTVIWMLGTAGVVAPLTYLFRDQCHRYEYGQVGVGTDCPHYTGRLK